MKWEIAKTFAIKAAPVLLGVLLGAGGATAVSKPSAEPRCPKVDVTCLCKALPIKAELVFPKK